MAYDQHLADRVERVFRGKAVDFEAKKMMGGLCFMVDGKMCCGIHYDKGREMDLLMARVGPDAYEGALEEVGAMPMDFTGRPMKGFVFVVPEGFAEDEDLEKWLGKCLEYNPIAKKSRKK